MKVTVEISEDDLQEICDLTGIAKKGPAIRQLLQRSVLAERRARIAGKFLSGEWSAELDDFETAREADRRRTTTLSEQWRDGSTPRSGSISPATSLRPGSRR